MGAIAGVLKSDGSRIDLAIASRMLSAIEHRGPDQKGVYHDGQAALANARLRTHAPDEPRLPLPNRDQSLWIAFDGEIFNDSELRRDLAGRGQVFTTQSDAEVVLAAYEEFGEDCVRHFNGQWSLAIWDSRNRRLFASRDRLGTRPFYYTPLPGEFLFASEIKSLLQHDGVPREIDLIALDQIFTLRSALPPRTIFRNIFELPPGFSLHWSDGVVQVFRHWQVAFDPDLAQDDRDAEERLAELLTDATRLRLRSEARVATVAEPDLASWLTAALADRSGETAAAGLATSFEASSARLCGDSLKGCQPADIGRVFPDVIRHAETPLLGSDPAVMYLLAEGARHRGHRVLLTGAGADELFGGCDIYKEARVRRYWSRQPDSQYRLQLLKRFFVEPAGTNHFPTAYWQAFFHARPRDLANPFFSHLARWEQTARLQTFFTADLRQEIGEYDAREELRLRVPCELKHWDDLSQAQFLEIISYFPGGVLSSQHDRMTMAHGIACRHPFLDTRVAEFALRLPARSKFRGLSEHEMLRHVASRLLPASQMRQRSAPIRVPLATSFFGTPEAPHVYDYVDELLSRERIVDAGIFEPGGVERLVRKAKKGEATGVKDTMALAGIVSTQLIVDQFIRAPARQPVAAG
jgi:asparagine synthase (glutamine-hydrolysing)